MSRTEMAQLAVLLVPTGVGFGACAVIAWNVCRIMRRTARITARVERARRQF